MATNKIIISQSLHGYHEGHRLLASSIQLEGDSRATVRVLSDMAGSSIFRHKKDYLTGYPLPQSGVYVIARTWPAPEMARPGCVWTHSLYFRFANLVELPDFTNLESLFRHPSLSPGFSAYSKDLELELPLSESMKDSTISGNRPKLLEAMIAGLYLLPDSQVIIEEDNSDEIEQSVLAIWKQQWLRLRRHFTFCTQSSVTRYLGNQPFDLQVYPTRSHFKLQIAPNGVIVSQEILKNLNAESNPMITLLLDDLVSGGNGLRPFLHKFGSSLQENRSGMISLVSVYWTLMQVKSKKSFFSLLDSILVSFPIQGSSKPLKNAFLGLERIVPFDIDEEEAKLCYLATTTHLEAIDLSELNPFERFLKFLNEDRKKFILALCEWLTIGLNEVGEAIVKKFALLVENQDLTIVNSLARPLLPQLVILNPTLAEFPAYWNITEKELDENISILMSGKLWYRIDWKAVLPILFSRNRIVSSEFLRDLKINYVGIILEVSNKDKPELLIVYKKLVRESPNSIIHWLNTGPDVSPYIMIILPEILALGSGNFDDLGQSAFQKLNIGLKKIASSPKTLPLKVFLLIIALRSTKKESTLLLQYSFESVHFAIYNDSLDSDLWKQLEPYLPQLKFWKEWDKCRKLRIAITKKIIFLGLPESSFAKFVTNEQLLEDLVERYHRIR